jgi:hypothetical protein
MPDLQKLNFFSKYPIDKIVQQGEITIVNDGATSSPQMAKIVESTTTNNYGRAGLVRARWTIDGGTNWQGLESQLTYFFTLSTVPGNPGHPMTIQLSGLDSAISVGSSAANITFRTANGAHGNVTNTDSPVYIPTSRTFRIQYILYERE